MNFARSTKVNDQTIALAYCISDIARYYRTCLDREMAAHGLTRSQWWLLANLQYNDGANQQELAELMEMGKSAVGKLIDQLGEICGLTPSQNDIQTIPGPGMRYRARQ